MGALAGSVTTSRTRSGSKHQRAGWFALGVLGLLTILPIVSVVLLVSDAGAHEFLRWLGRAEIRHVFVETGVVALVTSAVTLFLATPVGLFVGFSEGKRRLSLLWLFIIAGFTPFLVRGYAFVGLLGESGPIEAARRLLSLPGGPLLGTAAGVVLTLVHALAPTVVIITSTAVTEELKQELAAAAVLGAAPVRRSMEVVLPAIAPSLAAAFVFVFLTSVGAFSAPALVGGGRETLAVQVIYMHAIELSDMRTAGVLALLFVAALVIAGGVAGAFGWLLAGRRGVRIARAAADLLPRESWGPFVTVRRVLYYSLMSICIILVFAPILFVVGVSLQPRPLLAFPTHALSLAWYRRVAGDPSWVHAALTTLRVGVVAAFLSCTVSFAAAWAARHHASAFLRWSTRWLALAPAAMPAVMLGVGLYLSVSRVRLIGTELAVVLGLTVISLPITFLALGAGVSRYDTAVEDAAAVFGARRATRIASVRLPLLMPSLLAALVLSFLASIDEVAITLFMAGSDVQTVALRMWSSATQNPGPELAVPSTLLMMLSAAGVVLAFGQLGGTQALRPGDGRPSQGGAHG